MSWWNPDQNWYVSFSVCIIVSRGFFSFFSNLINSGEQRLTTFTTETHKRYNYLHLPQGFHNSPAALAKLTSNFFGHLDFLVCYADDMALLSTSKADHFEKFLKCIIRDNLKLSLHKSVHVENESFLGHRMKDGSISPTEKYISAIKTLKLPTDKSSLKRLLGSRNWLDKYIHNYSRKTRISYELLRKHVEFHWTKQHEAAFQEIKNYLISNHVLTLPTGTSKYSLFCDGLRQGIGATLLETVDGSTYVVN